MNSSIAFNMRWLLSIVIVISMGSSSLAKEKCKNLEHRYDIFLTSNIMEDKAWNTQNATCEDINTKLPIVKNQTKGIVEAMIQSIRDCCLELSSTSCSVFWGIERNNGVWQWLDGSKVDLTLVGISCSYRGTKSYCVISDQDKFNCTPCSSPLYVMPICQGKPAYPTTSGTSGSSSSNKPAVGDEGALDSTTAVNPWLHPMALTSYVIFTAVFVWLTVIVVWIVIQLKRVRSDEVAKLIVNRPEACETPKTSKSGRKSNEAAIAKSTKSLDKPTSSPGQQSSKKQVSFRDEPKSIGNQSAKKRVSFRDGPKSTGSQSEKIQSK